MHTRKRLVWFLALTTIIALTAACGGATEEPVVEEAPPAEEPAAAPETTPEPTEAPAPVQQPAEPPEQAIVGDIVEIPIGDDEMQMDWLTAASREVPGRYYWIVRLRNDTTSTLNLTVIFDFVNDEDEVIKTDRSTQRVSPAETAQYRVEGEMNRDDSRAVAGYTYTWTWEIVESG